MKIKFEGIAENLNDVELIDKSNSIERIELVKDLSKGGLTPDYEVIEKATKLTDIPIYVMIRPHDKSFIYSSKEFEEILKTITKIKELKIQGIVFGSLDENHEINTEQLQKVIDISKPLKITFHRAIDETSNYKSSIELLNEFEIENILTSGTKNKAVEGIENIKDAIEISKHNIMPGSGIDIDNITLFKDLKISYLHFGSALKDGEQISKNKINKLKEKIK